MVVERTGQLHPALYYGGLLKAAHRAGAKLCANCDAEKIERKPGGFRVLTSKGPIEAREVVIATNGYTTELTPTLRRKLVPVASHIIATEELPEDLVQSLIPKNRVVSDTKRALPTASRPTTSVYSAARPLHRVARGERAGAARLQLSAGHAQGRQGHACWTGNVAFARLPAAHGRGRACTI
jgi:glycine/D-amino acid oxidase-like deaminating enzyme